MTIFFSVAGVLTYLVWGLQGLESVHRHLGGLTNDLHLVTQQGVQLSELGSQAWGVMNETMPNCSKSAQERLTIAERSVAALLHEVGMYNMNITHVSKRLDAVQASLGRVPPKYLYSLALPLALVIAGCLMVILPVRWSSVAGEKCGRGCGKCCASCGSCCLRFSSVLFAPAIFLVATAAGLEYGIGLAAGSFCEGVDSNVLAYVESFEGEVAFNASRYYIEGNGSNPLLEKLQQANASLSDVSKQLKIHSHHIQEGCGGNATDVVDILLRSFAAMERPIDETAELLSAHHMYPYYSKMAHEKLCGSIIGGLAWLVMLQYIVGILCLPLLTCAADSLLQRQRLFWEHDASRRLVEGCGAEGAYPYEQQQQQHFGRPQQQQHFGRGDDVERGPGVEETTLPRR